MKTFTPNAVARACASQSPALAAYLGMTMDGAPAIDIKALTEQLKQISDDVKAAGEKAIAEAKKSGDMYAADKPKVDEMLTKQGELQARLLEAEQKLARRGGPGDEDVQLSAGQTLVRSEEYKAFAAGGGLRSAQSGFQLEMPRAALTSVSTTNATTVGVAPDMQAGILPLAQRRMTIRDLLSPGTTSSNLIQYVKETGFTNAAAPVSEGTQKPESTLAYALVQSAVITIAHWIKASKIILDDLPALASMIDQRLRYGLMLVEENQLLKGSGTGNNLNGIYTQATAYAAPITVPAPSKIDVLRLMILQTELAEFPATGIVLHPSDWAAIELKKDTLGRYIIGNPQGTLTPSLWGRPVVATPAMTLDTALVGAFKMGAQIFDRETANVVIATENVDDFIKNMITIRAEERLALAVYRPEAFVKNGDLVGS